VIKAEGGLLNRLKTYALT